MLGGAALGWLATVLDRRLGPDGVGYLLPATLGGSRTVLGTIAGATITVAALVFSITALTVQLASSQYSPRVLQGFLRDRFHQSVIGIVTGTFTYAVVALATVGGNRTAGENAVVAAWATTIGLILAVATVVAIVAFIDHITKRIRVDDMIRRLTQATTESMDDVFDRDRATTSDDSWQLDPSADSATIRADSTGWAQLIDPHRLMGVLPEGAVVRIDIATGDHVTRLDRVATVWPSEAADEFPHSDHWLTVGDTRTTEQDPGFGIRQMVDIALRALSPGINDPATAADVVRHLVEPLRVALTHPPRQRVVADDGGRRIMLPEEPDRNDYVRLALSEIRIASDSQLLVITAFIDTVGSLLEHLRANDIDPSFSGLEGQLELLLTTMDRSALSGADLDAVTDTLRHWRLEWPESVA